MTERLSDIPVKNSLRVRADNLALKRVVLGKAQRNARRPLRVMKFGGTSVGNAECIRQVANIIAGNLRDSELVVVVSAMAGVTNELIEAAALAEARKLDEAVKILARLRQRHEETAGALIPAVEERARICGKIRELLDECQRWCEATARLGELTPRMRDAISSLGERLSAPLVAAILGERGIASVAIDAMQLVVTDSFHGAADPKLDLTERRCEGYLSPLLRKKIVPVVTGFIGATEDGVLTTLGRGGSDYSASILGAALKADGVIIWTDVEGMLTADPRLVSGAKTIPEISYREASELAYFGAKVLHPKTLHPLMQQGIPVWIRSTFAPQKVGTKITPEGNTDHSDVKALTAVSEAALIKIGGPAISQAHDVLGRTLASTKAVRADVLMISKSPSRNHIFLVVAANSADRTAQALHHEFLADAPHRASDHVVVDSSVAILTVVGENLYQVKAIVGRTMDELSRDGVNILATGQGASNCSVSFVVSRMHFEHALATAHREFELIESAARKEQTPKAEAHPARRESETVRSEVPELSSRGEDFQIPGTPRIPLILDEPSFRKMIARERKRTERSRNPVVLMLLDAGTSFSTDRNGRVVSEILSALSLATRETDVIGWYKHESVVGVMFTELGMEDSGAILGTMMHRVSGSLRGTLSSERFNQISIAMHVFPDSWEQETSTVNPTLYPDLEYRRKSQWAALAAKRGIDIVGSLLAITIFAPIFLAVAALVKLSSKGPVLFQQERLGQFGQPFTFLKFRSMYVNNDPKIHQEFMKRVINGDHDGESDGREKKIYKMTNDPRITRVGRFLRKTSLDELPQFFNVLQGQMSLVGPRPPLAYECQEYEVWHRRRVLEVKPGITGLWQVKGRSRVRFDDMVRLDLQYVREWSVWNDIKIIFKTPFAILRGGDAF